MLFVTATLVVAGCFGAVAYARLTGISAAVASALLLLGIVALSGQAASSVARRRAEIGLAQLRGRTGVRLLWSAVAEPVVILLAATAVGVGIGWELTRVAVGRWLAAGTAFSPTWHEWAAVGVVLAVGVLVVVLASWRTTYESILDKLVGQNRPRPAKTGLLFLQLCVLVGAVVTMYQARQSGPRHADWVSLLSPALLGLACGMVTVWLVRVIAALAARSRAGNRLGWFVTTRRLFRRADSVVVLPVMIAAAVLAVVAANAWVAADTWRQDTARLSVGAPISYPVATGALSAYEASERADPGGRWLMAAVAFRDPTGGSYRRVFVDSSRWQRVVGDFYAGTPASDIGRRLSAFPAAPPVRPLRGDSFTMVASKNRFYHRHTLGGDSGYLATPDVSLFYVDDTGALSSVDVPPQGRGTSAPAGPGMVRWTVPVDDCHHGCLPTEIDFAGQAPKRAPMHITGLSFLGRDLLGSGPAAMRLRPAASIHVTRSAAGLSVWTSGFFSPARGSYANIRLGSWAPQTGPASALTTSRAPLDKVDGQPAVYGVDGTERPVRVVGSVPVLPFVGSEGALLDLPTAVAGQGATAADARAVVLARADTPRHVLDHLRATGVVGRPSTYEAALVKARQQTAAQGVRLYLLIACFAALLAVVTAIAAVADQIGGRRKEAASLRSVGLSARGVAKGYMREAVVLAVAVAAASVAAGWIGCRALLGALPLVDPGRFGLALDTAPRFSLIVPVALGAGVVLWVVVTVAFRRVGRSSPPASLREDLG